MHKVNNRKPPSTLL